MSSPVEDKHISEAEKAQGLHTLVAPALEADEHELAEAEDVIKTEAQYSDKQMNRLRWKVDFIMMPIMMLTYGLQYS
jgi:hypothetical protein